MKPFPVLIDSAEKFNKLFDNVDYILTDCDGVLFLHDIVIDGANTFLNEIRKLSNKKIIYATNNSSKSRRIIMQKLHNLGFEANNDEVMVTSYAAGLYLKKMNFDKKVYVFGSQGIEEEFSLLNLNFVGFGPDELHACKQQTDFSKIILDPEVQAIVLGFDFELSYAKLVRASSYAKKVAENWPQFFIATNLDETLPTSFSELCVPGTGSLVRCITTAIGREPEVIMGKPYKFFFDCIKQIHPQIDPARCVMIGDRLDTDIKFASNNGFKFSLFVQSGAHSLSDIERAINNKQEELIPTHYVSNLGDLVKFLK